jgi:hypothetical protein
VDGLTAWLSTKRTVSVVVWPASPLPRARLCRESGHQPRGTLPTVSFANCPVVGKDSLCRRLTFADGPALAKGFFACPSGLFLGCRQRVRLSATLAFPVVFDVRLTRAQCRVGDFASALIVFQPEFVFALVWWHGPYT